MREKILKLFFLFLLLIPYFILFNILTLINFSETSILNPSIDSGTIDQAAIEDKVVVTSFHNGVLWDITTIHYSNYKDSTILFLRFIPLPLTLYGFSLVWLHFGSSLVFLLISLIIIFYERRYYE